MLFMKFTSILYIYPHPSTFILRDIEILSDSYNVTSYLFDVRKKWLTPYQFLVQFFYLLFRIRNFDVLICHFAGYASFLPVLFGKIFKKPCFIIVAGNDGSKFPDFHYGNYTKKLLGFFTGKSLQLATHILPVHESLVYQDYDYYEGGKPAQGYSYFFPKAGKTPYTPVYYGYDTQFFKPDHSARRNRNCFITIGNLGDKYAFKRKGSDLIIEYARLRPDLSFTIVGRNGSKSIEVPDNVTLLPYMSSSEIVKTLSQHEYYFQLSIMEGFPNALAEAMLCGCIPIGSNVSGIPFIIGETGYILNKRDIHELNLLVEKALCDNRRDQLPGLARERIAQHFTYSRRREMFEKVIGMYQNQ
jgi:glycosyltransferase involved in cell wall biosynthesis